MTTTRDLVKSSFRLLGIYANSEEPSADEITDAIQSLNFLKDSLNLANQMAFDTENTTYPFVGNQATYNLGPTGDWVIAVPPVEITKITIYDTATQIDFPCSIITDSDYANIALKTTGSNIPQYVVLNPQADSSMNLTFWTVPTDSSYSATIYYQSQVPTFQIDTDIILPPGYLRMYAYNLALEIAPEYGIAPSDLVINNARESLADVKRQNHIAQTIGCDAGVVSKDYYYTWPDWLSGQ